MVGSHPYWINGECYEKDCDNFAILGFSIARAESGIENLGHMTESILNQVFEVSEECCDTGLKFDSIEELNLWERFILCKHTSVIHIYAGKTMRIPAVILQYQSEKTKVYDTNAEDGCISVSDPTILTLQGGKMTGLRKGEAELIICMDGKKFSYHVS